MPTPPPLPKPRRAIWPWVALAGLFLPVLIVLGWYVSYRVSNASAVRALEAKVRERGEPLTLKELAAKFPPIPDAENAAIPLMELWEREDPRYWRAFRNNERPMPARKRSTVDPLLPYLGAKARRISRVQALSEAQFNAADDWLRANAERATEIRNALQRPRCRFPVRVTEGYAALLPHYAEIKWEAQSFRIHAVVATERGDATTVIDALKDMQRTGDTLAEEPLLIAQLIRIACHLMIIESTELLLSRQQLSEAQLARLQDLYTSLRLTNALRSCLISERVVALSAFETEGDSLSAITADSGDEDVSGSDVKTGVRFMHAIGLAAADRRLMLETLEQAIALAEKDRPEALLNYEELHARVERKARSFPPKVFCIMLLPALDKTAAKFAALEARRRAGLAAIAIERYRVAHNGQPASLDALMPKYLPAIPEDPFNGNALQFQQLAKGFVVYSVGANRADDGGSPQKKFQKSLDETFIVER